METADRVAISLMWIALVALLLVLCGKIENKLNTAMLLNKRYHEHVCIQPSVVVDEPAIGDTPIHLMGEASEGFEGDGLVGIEPVYCYVTHYGPPRFHRDRTTSRCITIRACLLLVDHYADEWGVEIDGFCAVHKYIAWPDGTLTDWYKRHRDATPMLLYVEGHGNYLVLDRKGLGDCVGVDIYEPDQDGYMYCDRGIRVWEVNTDDS